MFVMERLAPLAIAPTFQLMMPLVTTTPDALLDTNVAPPGIVWLKTTPVPALGPLLTTVATLV